MEDIRKSILAVIAKQKEMANIICTDYLNSSGQITEFASCFDKLQKGILNELDGFTPDLEFTDLREWFENNTIDSEETFSILEQLDADYITDYFQDNIREDEDKNAITIKCDNLVQREKLQTFLETEIFTDCLRYNACVDNL
jgi:hypothetical protein